MVASGKQTVVHAACAASGLGTAYSLSVAKSTLYMYRTDVLAHCAIKQPQFMVVPSWASRGL